jgi:hypothetical protein
MKSRSNIPQKTADALMVANFHTCCICQEPRKHVAIHHIDSNPHNHDPANLAVVCHDCHSRVTGDEGLGRQFTPAEVSLCKQRWEKYCANDRGAGNENDELQEPEQLLYEIARIEGGTHLTHEFSLDAGDEILVGISADEYIDVSICTPADYQCWLDDPNDLKEYGGASEVRACELSVVTPRKGTYLLLLINHSDEDAEVTIDVSVWSDDE